MTDSQIASIQAALGIGWQAYIEQQYVIGAQQIAAAAFFVLVFWRAFAGGMYFWIRYRSDEHEYGDSIIGAVICWIGCAIVAMLTLGLALDGVGHFINPVGYAVQGVLNAVHGPAS